MSDIPKILLQAAELDGHLAELLAIAAKDFRDNELPQEKRARLKEARDVAC
jgi:hypothetical protein